MLTQQNTARPSISRSPEATAIRHVYLAGLTPIEESFVWESFRAEPVRGWEIALLTPSDTLPDDVLDGRAVLVIGCNIPKPRDHQSTMWLLRLLFCGTPWLAITNKPDAIRTIILQELQAEAVLPQPAEAKELRRWLLDENKRGDRPRKRRLELTPEQVLKCCLVFDADILLSLTNANGQRGQLAIQRGQVIGAQLDDGLEGWPALRTTLDWTDGRLSAKPLPKGQRRNLEPVADLLTGWAAPESTPPPFDSVAVCQRFADTLEAAHLCCVIDANTATVVGHVAATPQQEDFAGFAQATLTLLQHTTTEATEEVILGTKTDWCLAAWLVPGAYAVLVRATGHPQYALAHVLVAEARDAVTA